MSNPIDLNNFEQLIEKKAYELYIKRGFKMGHDWADWFEAEKSVEEEISNIDKDCIRSESFYITSHQSSACPSDIDTKEIMINSFVRDF